ncbi:hypothetical protein PRVXH_000488 [Proteinivorax hydrogeniformans]|uniref:Flagellar operon protein (TIGR03826 family) n=1 Tax=Proteinivorax hydrogeniformans TaxID=1826727 RepID=A0AAU8HUV5_9FIRM
MTVSNCPRCGKIFRKLKRNICPNCVAKEDKEYEIVRDFLYDNPGAGIQTITEETGVSENQVIKFLREDRLVNVNKDSLLLDCESCGTAISNGRYCEACKARLDSDIRGVAGGGTTDRERKASSFHLRRLKDK